MDRHTDKRQQTRCNSCKGSAHAKVGAAAQHTAGAVEDDNAYIQTCSHLVRDPCLGRWLRRSARSTLQASLLCVRGSVGDAQSVALRCEGGERGWTSSALVCRAACLSMGCLSVPLCARPSFQLLALTQTRDSGLKAFPHPCSSSAKMAAVTERGVSAVAWGRGNQLMCGYKAVRASCWQHTKWTKPPALSLPLPSRTPLLLSHPPCCTYAAWRGWSRTLLATPFGRDQSSE